MSHPVVHFEVSVRDKQALENFYRDVFAWQINPLWRNTHWLPKREKASVVVSAICWGTQGTSFYVQVEDVNAALTLIESKGGRKAFAPHAVTDGSVIACFLDPEGHLVRIVQPPNP